MQGFDVVFWDDDGAGRGWVGGFAWCMVASVFGGGRMPVV